MNSAIVWVLVISLNRGGSVLQIPFKNESDCEYAKTNVYIGKTRFRDIECQPKKKKDFK
jgi:hypothetical protein